MERWKYRPHDPHDPADPLELILEASAAGVIFGPEGWSASWSVDVELVEALEELAPLVGAVLAGRSSHRWGPCSVCGEGLMVRKATKPRCRLTPGCKGFHVGRALPRGFR